jgi:hypothetical protein
LSKLHSSFPSQAIGKRNQTASEIKLRLVVALPTPGLHLLLQHSLLWTLQRVLFHHAELFYRIKLEYRADLPLYLQAENLPSAGDRVVQNLFNWQSHHVCSLLPTRKTD